MTVYLISAPTPFTSFRSSLAQRKSASHSLPSKSFDCERLQHSPPNLVPTPLKTVAASTSSKESRAYLANNTNSMPHLRPPDMDWGGNIRSIPSSTKPSASSLGEPVYRFPTNIAQ